MTVNFVTYRLLIDYPLIIGNNQWLTDYPLITHRLPIDVIDFIDEICIMNYNYVCIISFIFSKFGSTGQNRFSLTFYRRNLVVFPWNLAWNSFYTVENPNLLGCPLNSPPIDKNFSSVKNLTINFQQFCLHTDLLRIARIATGRCTLEAKFEALQRHYIRIYQLIFCYVI